MRIYRKAINVMVGTNSRTRQLIQGLQFIPHFFDEIDNIIRPSILEGKDFETRVRQLGSFSCGFMNFLKGKVL